jgi:hypothetical protein
LALKVVLHQGIRKVVNFASFRRFVALVGATCVVLANYTIPAGFAKSANIVLDILYRATQVANLSYDGKSRILGELKGKSAWVTTPGTADVQYVSGYKDQLKINGK